MRGGNLGIESYMPKHKIIVFEPNVDVEMCMPKLIDIH